MDKDPHPGSGSESVFKQILHTLLFWRHPDTKEDLEQEIQELIDDGEEHGLITAQEGQMINNIFEFRETIAREIMTPRPEMILASSNATFSDLVKIINSEGLSRIPIYSEDPDNITGMLYAKDMLRYLDNSHKPIAGEIAKPAYFASENRKIVDLLRDFQTRKVHISIITDEFGGVRGLVTLEDILEEIVGEIDDETDKAENSWTVVDEKTVLADEKIDIDLVETHFDIEFPGGSYESLGGLIIHQLGHLPEPGTIVKLDNLSFTVLSATKRRILKVKIQKNGEEQS